MITHDMDHLYLNPCCSKFCLIWSFLFQQNLPEIFGFLKFYFFLNQHAIIITASLLAESLNSAVLSSGCTLESLGSFWFKMIWIRAWALLFHKSFPRVTPVCSQGGEPSRWQNKQESVAQGSIGRCKIHSYKEKC